MSLDSAVSTLLQRLEQVTARLESVEKQLASGSAGGAAPTAPSAAAAAASAATAAAAADSPLVQEWDDMIAEHFKTFSDAAAKCSGLLPPIAAQVKAALDDTRSLIVRASQCAKPAEEKMNDLLKAVNEKIAEISKIRDSNNKSPQMNEMKAISEGIGALFWVVIQKTPAPHVKEYRGQAEFWGNRVLKEHKGTGNEDPIKFIQAWYGLLTALESYVKKHHTTGLSWNPRGGDAMSWGGGGAPAGPTAGAAKPPPPAPPKGFFDDVNKGAAGDTPKAREGAATGALFAELNKGGDVTSGLKKVTNDMKTKNMKDRSGVVAAAPTKATGADKWKPKGDPVLVCESGKKWRVENQYKNNSIDIVDTEPSQSVYVSKCSQAVIKVKGKINSIMLDSCHKTAVIFESVIASVELVNCQSCDIQCLGKCPQFLVDKTSGANLVVSKDCLDSEFVTSKIDAVNISYPTSATSDDMTETPVPEQFKTIIKNGKLVTESVRHE